MGASTNCKCQMGVSEVASQMCFSTTVVHQLEQVIISLHISMQIDDCKFGKFRSIYLWACLKMRKRNPRNPEMIHSRKPLDFWAP